MTFWDDFQTFMWVRYFNFADLLKTTFLYYRKPKFAVVDLTLLISYFFKSPYRIGREYKSSEPYGETPLATLDTLLSYCPIRPDDTVYELGSGRGRACFWLSLFKGYKTVGIEYIPTFVERAQKLAGYFNVNNVEFRCEDILKADLSKATWIYLFGSALPDDTITRLTKRIEHLKPGTKIITISYPLTAYTCNDIIVVTNTVDVTFPWGETQAYIQEVVGQASSKF